MPIRSVRHAGRVARLTVVAILLFSGMTLVDVVAEEASTPPADEPAPEKEAEEKKGSPIKARYDKGLHVASADGNFAAVIKWRVQMRLTDVTSPDLVGQEDGIDEETGFLIRRARFKLDGHAYRPWLSYKLEYGIEGNFLLTWEMDMNRWEPVGLRVGQYKVLYNRERVDSSGKLQFVDRSIVNNPFTVDRQSGFTLMGHAFKESRADSLWAVGVFTGTGRGGELDSDRQPMYTARWQWNFLKRDLPFSEGDLARRKKPAASLALAAASNVSPYTAFSSAGGGQLPGFADGVSGQYKLEQWMGELAYHGRGLSLQGEYHRKRIDDRVNDALSELWGFYAQAGYFFHEAFAAFPKPLELAVRIAKVDSVSGVAIPADREETIAANWFFHGHDNKLTVDVSHLENTQTGADDDTGWRTRFQWDVSF